MQFLKKTIFLYAILLIPFASQAQLIGLNDNCNPLIKSLNDVLFVVKQEFVLSDKDGNEFGKDGNDYFGFGYGPAVMVNGELVFSNRTYSPYLVDSAYKSYGEEYTPKSGNTFFKNIKAKAFEAIATESLNHNKNYESVPVLDVPFCSYSNHKPGDSIDCIVITYLPNELSLTENSTFTLSYLYNKVSWGAKKGSLTNNALGSKAVFGLIFYEVIGNGEAHLEFGGFVEKNGKEWVCTPYSSLSAIAPLNKVEDGKKNKKKKP